MAKKNGIASKALEIIGKLYDIEAQIKDFTADEKLQIRKAQAKPILTAFHVWLLEIKPTANLYSLMETACHGMQRLTQDTQNQA